MKKVNISAMDAENLIAERRKLKKEAMNLRFQQAMGQLKNTAGRRQVRRQIARVLTRLTAELSLRRVGTGPQKSQKAAKEGKNA